MTTLTDISVSNFTTLLYSTADDVTPASDALTEVQSIGELTDEKTIIDVQQYGKKYLRKLSGTANAGPIEVIVNLNPSDSTHAALISAYDNDTPLYFWLVMHTPAGYGVGSVGDYVSFKGFVASKSISNEFDSARTMTFSIAIDGAVSPLTPIPAA